MGSDFMSSNEAIVQWFLAQQDEVTLALLKICTIQFIPESRQLCIQCPTPGLILVLNDPEISDFQSVLAPLNMQINCVTQQFEKTLW